MSRSVCVVSLMKLLFSCECHILTEPGECATARSFHPCLLDSTQKSGSGWQLPGFCTALILFMKTFEQNEQTNTVANTLRQYKQLHHFSVTS